jgi:phage terminase small subunit
MVRITEKLRIFAANYLANGGNATEALRSAGSSAKPQNLDSIACRMLKKARESGLMKQALERVTAKPEADLREALATLTAQMREERHWSKKEIELPRGLDAALTPEQRAALEAPYERRFEPGLAASKIVDHLGQQTAPQGNRTVVFNLLAELPKERLRELMDGLIAGGNGNGNGQP